MLQVRLHSSCRAAGEPKVLQADEGEILVEDSIDCVSTAVVADGANVPGQARCARRWRGEGADRLQKPEPVGLARPSAPLTNACGSLSHLDLALRAR